MINRDIISIIASLTGAAVCHFEFNHSQFIIDLVYFLLFSDSSGFVAFYVRRNSNWGPVTTPQAIPYDIVNMDIGATWDIDANMFTAPVGGIYHFDYAHQGGIVWLMINGVYYQEVRSHSTYTGSSGATIQLQTGDQVWIELYNDNVQYIYCQGGGEECSFSGFLVYEII